jgi:hypothetical protein
MPRNVKLSIVKHHMKHILGTVKQGNGVEF